MLLWILFVVSAIFAYVKLWKPHQYFKEKNVIHSKPWPIVGNMLNVILRKAAFVEQMEAVYQNAKNARYYGFYNFLKPVIVIKDPDLWKQVAIKDFDSFLDHRGLANEEMDPLFGKGIFQIRGEKWKNMRSILSPAFTSSKMRAMFILMTECADNFTDKLLTMCRPNNYKAFEMKDIFTRFANDVIASCGFGIKCDSLLDKENEFYLMGKRGTKFSLVKLWLFSIVPFIMIKLKIRFLDDDFSSFFRHLVKTTMEEREKNGIIRPDMIHLLMKAKKGELKYEETVKSKEDDTGFATVEESQVGQQKLKHHQSLTDDDITAQVVGFLFAGFDMTANALCHMAHELAVNPEIHQKLQQEIDEMLENGEGKVTYEQVAKMKYMDMVVSETMRKWPPILTDRLCSKSYTINPIHSSEQAYTVNQGEVIWFPIFNIQRDPKYYPNPERFDPERFNDENKKNINQLPYAPFGTGPRNCMGSRFAIMEMKTIFVYLLSKFDIVADQKTEIPLKISRKEFGLVPDNGFWLGLKPRT